MCMHEKERESRQVGVVNAQFFLNSLRFHNLESRSLIATSLGKRSFCKEKPPSIQPSVTMSCTYFSKLHAQMIVSSASQLTAYTGRKQKQNVFLFSLSSFYSYELYYTCKDCKEYYNKQSDIWASSQHGFNLHFSDYR